MTRSIGLGTLIIEVKKPFSIQLRDIDDPSGPLHPVILAPAKYNALVLLPESATTFPIEKRPHYEWAVIRIEDKGEQLGLLIADWQRESLASPKSLVLCDKNKKLRS